MWIKVWPDWNSRWRIQRAASGFTNMTYGCWIKRYSRKKKDFLPKSESCSPKMQSERDRPSAFSSSGAVFYRFPPDGGLMNWCGGGSVRSDFQVLCLQNLRLKYDNLDIEHDLVIIAPTGVFSVEVKNKRHNGIISEKGILKSRRFCRHRTLFPSSAMASAARSSPFCPNSRPRLASWMERVCFWNSSGRLSISMSTYLGKIMLW